MLYVPRTIWKTSGKTMQAEFHNQTRSLIARLMGPTWDPSLGSQDPDGPHVGPVNLAIWGSTTSAQTSAVPCLRSLQQSNQAWNSLANYSLCPYRDMHLERDWHRCAREFSSRNLDFQHFYEWSIVFVKHANQFNYADDNSVSVISKELTL